MAAKPGDIYWYNMKISDAQRTKNVIYSYIVLAMILIITFASLLGIEFWRYSVYTSNSGGGTWILGLMGLISFLINSVLGWAIYLLSDLEKHKTKNDQLRHLIIKTILSQGINSVFLYYILDLFKPANPLSSLGLVTKVNYLVIISAGVNILWYIFPPIQLLNDFLNKIRYKPGERINLFQYQLN
jgi:hypothetical protein